MAQLVLTVAAALVRNAHEALLPDPDSLRFVRFYSGGKFGVNPRPFLNGVAADADHPSERCEAEAFGTGFDDLVAECAVVLRGASSLSHD